MDIATALTTASRQHYRSYGWFTGGSSPDADELPAAKAGTMT